LRGPSRLQDGDPWDVEFLVDVQKLKAYADLQQDSRLEQVEAFLALCGTHGKLEAGGLDCFGTPRASEASEWLSVPPTLFRWPAETETVRTVEFDQIAARTRSGTTENRLFCASGHGPPFHSKPFGCACALAQKALVALLSLLFRFSDAILIVPLSGASASKSQSEVKEAFLCA